MRSVREASNLKGKRVFVRSSLNEPIDEGVIRSDFRLKKMLPLITLLRDAGAKIILAGHLSGDPEGKTLAPVARYFEDSIPITFIEDVFSDSGRSALANMQDGDVVMLENLRRYPGEVFNDKDFAVQLASLADIYVNENFAAAHREHASIVSLPNLLPSYIGLQFEQEFEYLSRALKPPRPSLIILGGAKPETKIPLAKQFLDVADKIFVGGLPANEFFVARGYNLGLSLVSGKNLGVEAILNHPKLILPKDFRVLSEDDSIAVKLPQEIGTSDRIVDVGPETLVSLASVIAESSFIVWNGPLGDSDHSFLEGTEHLARLIADSGAQSIVGGGDTVAAVESIGVADRFTFLSTAGAAMLDFLVDGTLPAIVALENSEPR